jgi:hypothetical protein
MLHEIENFVDELISDRRGILGLLLRGRAFALLVLLIIGMFIPVRIVPACRSRFITVLALTMQTAF